MNYFGLGLGGIIQQALAHAQQGSSSAASVSPRMTTETTRTNLYYVPNEEGGGRWFTVNGEDWQPYTGDASAIKSEQIEGGGDSGGSSTNYYTEDTRQVPWQAKTAAYGGLFPSIEGKLTFGESLSDQERNFLRQFAGGANDQDLWNNAVRDYQHRQDPGSGWSMDSFKSNPIGFATEKAEDLTGNALGIPGLDPRLLKGEPSPVTTAAIIAGGALLGGEALAGMSGADAAAFVNGSGSAVAGGTAAAEGGAAAGAGAEVAGALTMPAAVPESAAALTDMGLTQTAPGAWESVAPAAATGGGAGGIIGSQMAAPAATETTAATTTAATSAPAAATAAEVVPGGAMDMTGAAAYPNGSASGSIFDVGNLSTGSMVGDLWAGLPPVVQASLLGGIVSGTVGGIGNYIVQSDMMEKRVQADRDLLAQKTEEENKDRENKRRLIQSGDYFSATLPFKPAKGAVLRRPNGQPGPSGIIGSRLAATGRPA